MGMCYTFHCLVHERRSHIGITGEAGTSGPTKLATPKIRPIDVNQEKIVGEIDSEILILLQRPD